MRSAPSVNFPVGRSRLCALVLGLAWCLALTNLAIWLLLGPAPGWRQGVVALLLLGCVPLAVREWRRQHRGELAWNGADWELRWAGGSEIVQLGRVWDGQRWLLLQVTGFDAKRARVQWIWAEQGADTAIWPALRRAVYFRAGGQALPDSASASVTSP